MILYKKNIIKKIVKVLLVVNIFAISTWNIYADNLPTTVIVGNLPPAFVQDAYESRDVDPSIPLNETDTVTFKAIANDVNAANYYLIICRSNSANINPGEAPICTGGEFCTSTLTSSGTQAACSYSIQHLDPEVNYWYAFVCDNNSQEPECSAPNQGTGITGSPFKVNHSPIFDTISNDGPKKPGEQITWSTNSATLDNDSDEIGDTVKLVVCKTTGLLNGACDGGLDDTFCTSQQVINNPKCSYELPIPFASKAYDSFTYILDSHNLQSTSTLQGAASSFSILNIEPEINNVILNSGEDISLTENSMTPVTISFTISDNNGCQELAQVTGYIYRSGVGFNNCDNNGKNNPNNCYADILCTPATQGNDCKDSQDATAQFNCTGEIYYFADPTDVATPNVNESWLSSVKVIDNSSANQIKSSEPVEMLSLIGYEAFFFDSYGDIKLNSDQSPLTLATTIKSTGNTGMDLEVESGEPNLNGTRLPFNIFKYSLLPNTRYSDAQTFKSKVEEIELNTRKEVSTIPQSNKDIFWGIYENSQNSIENFTGSYTIKAIRSELSEW